MLKQGTGRPRGGRPAVLAGRSRMGDLLLAALGGLITDMAFPSRSWWPLAYVGIALLLLALRRESVIWGWLVAFIWGLGFFLPHLWWANPAVGEPIGWIALSLAQAAMVAPFGAGAVLAGRVGWIRARPWLWIGAMAVLWVAVETVRARWPFGGLPWGTLAFSQTEAPLVRLAPLGSTTLVSAAVVVIAGALLYAGQRLARKGVNRQAVVGAGVAGLLAVGPALVPLPDGAENGTVRIGAVQGNVPEQGAEALSQARQVTANHAAGTHALLDHVQPGELDLVLWPESSADIDPRTDPELGRIVDEAASVVAAPILVGTQRLLADPDAPADDPGRLARYNESFVWEPGGGPASDLVYAKQHPVPFGEYIPYRDFFRLFTDAVDLVSIDMLAGTEPGMLDIPMPEGEENLALGVGICFEVAYDGIVREAVLEGGELVVIPTNNASYDRTALSAQQLAMSRFRAVEHSRAVVQISTMGLSAIVAPSGEMLQETELWTADQMVATVPLRTSLTPAALLGPWPGVVLLMLAGLLVAQGLVITVHRRRREHRANGVLAPLPTSVQERSQDASVAR